LKRRQQNLQQDGPSKKIKTTIVTPPPDGSISEPRTVQSLGLEAEDIELAVDTLKTLAQNPGVIKSKACKELRTAVYDFRQACTTGFNASVDTNLTARISGALADGGYTEARILLAEMRIREQTPKLGALCRWVRDLDVVSGLAEQVDGGIRTAHEVELLTVLDSILRTTGPIDYTSEGSFTTGPMVPRLSWDLRDRNALSAIPILDSEPLPDFMAEVKSQLRIIETIPGLNRKPPNHHPAVLYTSKDDSIKLSPTPPKITHHKHAIIPNLHLLKDVFELSECKSIIAAGESAGFLPDAPIRGEGEEISILAHNFYWVVDTTFHDKLWRRVSTFVPESVGGRKVRGLNRRFRMYRYVPGAEYRAHIDGAWPPSGIDLTTDTYIYDNSPPGASQSSLFTFLMYLNDDFEGGETTFFLPSAKEGTMNAYPVKPITGSVAMFPHGEAEGSLLHEGTGVRKGAKYVIRTDVLYDIDP